MARIKNNTSWFAYWVIHSSHGDWPFSNVVPVEEIPLRCDARFSSFPRVRGQHRSNSVKVLFWVADKTTTNISIGTIECLDGSLGTRSSACKQSPQKGTWQRKKTKEELCESPICQFNCTLLPHDEHFDDDEYAPVSGRLFSSNASQHTALYRIRIIWWFICVRTNIFDDNCQFM